MSERNIDLEKQQALGKFVFQLEFQSLNFIT